jgi:hypothetical protein
LIDMRQHFVIDPLISKRQQLLLATQLCRMVLKVRFYMLFPPSIAIHYICRHLKCLLNAVLPTTSPGLPDRLTQHTPLRT